MTDPLGATANIAQIIQAILITVALVLLLARGRQMMQKFVARSGKRQREPGLPTSLSVAIWVTLAVVVISTLINSAALTEKIGLWPAHKPEQVLNKHFKDEIVTVDNKEFYD